MAKRIRCVPYGVEVLSILALSNCRLQSTAAVLCLVAIVLGLSSCDAGETEGDADNASVGASDNRVTFTDLTGETITLPQPPRVACADQTCSVVMADLGLKQAAARGLGAPAFYYAPGDTPLVIPNDLNPEWFVANDIDVYVAASRPRSPEAELLADVIQWVWIARGEPGEKLNGKRPTPLEAYYFTTRMIADMMGVPSAEAERIINRFEAHMEALAAVAPPGAGDIEVSYFFDRGSGEFLAYGPRMVTCQAMQNAGIGKCVSPVDEVNLVNSEAVLALDPQWIGIVDYSLENRIVKENDAWAHLTAVKEGRVFVTDLNPRGWSLVETMYHTQRWAYEIWGEDSGVPDPGRIQDWDPDTKSIIAISK
ncbi:ABC transporter substrate-binding protein [Algihabitans sp.]|uniref:ABC transporter substrate-binding protein n=1 Tax=Algihabitans sp. TaxID=2821514 RepID=UPI003BA8DC0C